MLNIANYQTSANKYYNDEPSHTNLNGHNLKVYKQEMLERVWRKENPPTLLVGMQIGEATMENSTEVPQKTKNRVAIWSSNPTPGHISRQNYNSKRYMDPYVHSSTIYDSQDMEAT